MHHDFFAWVRLLLFIILILAFATWCSIAESRYKLEHPDPEEPEQEGQTYYAQEIPVIPFLKAQAAPEPTFSNHLEEITPLKKAATIAAENPTEPTYTADELEMLALVIYQEAGADWCSDDTRLMVGTVVMNRIADPRFPDTMHEVITERLAYGLLHWTGAVWPTRASYSTEAHAVERAYTIAERILMGERTLPEYVVFQSEYIMGEIVAFSDGMYFCR